MNAIDMLMALSPLDGRYAARLGDLREVFSEFGLIKRRVVVELAWLAELSRSLDAQYIPDLSGTEHQVLASIGENFSLEDAQRVKEIERTTNHDVKAVEYFIKERLSATSLTELGEFVHFACTSEDINNMAHALMLRDGVKIITQAQEDTTQQLLVLATSTRHLAMLAHTHGQPASPTTLGKELAVFAARLQRQAKQIKDVKLCGKMNGAVGNYNAHLTAFPAINWEALAARVIEGHFGLQQNLLTIQIEPHDYIAELFDAMIRWNIVLMDMNRDLWQYISMGYLIQKTVANEVGSSTMPHKVNPIDFENSEGNLGMANALLAHMARKLPISRLQRDLTDSTVLRNMGTGFGYTLIACHAAQRGLQKVSANPQQLADDLDHAWEVLAEPIQTVMRKYKLPNPYEQLKEMTRGRAIDATAMRDFITGLEIEKEDKERLLALSPATYTGMAAELVDHSLCN